MGGIGSGRRNQAGKDTVDDCRSLDVRRWGRDGLLTSGLFFTVNWTRNGETVASMQVRTEADKLTLTYKHGHRGGLWQAMEYPVWLSWTACTYGGRRAWFRCPVDGCGRRVALLYLGASGVFACRHCNRLVYPCQRERADDRAMRQADKIRQRLDWEAGIMNGKGPKPKGMHRRTFERLNTKHDAFAAAPLANMAEQSTRLERLLNCP